MDSTTHRIIRLSLAVVFLYAPIAAFIDPTSWIGYLPSFTRDLPVDPAVSLHIIGSFEVVLAVWFLVGKRLFVPSVIATVFLIGIVLTHTSQLDVLFRDISLALVAVALGVDSWKKYYTNKQKNLNDTVNL